MNKTRDDWEAMSGRIYIASLHVLHGTGSRSCDLCGEHTRGWSETWVVEMRVDGRKIAEVDVCRNCFTRMDPPPPTCPTCGQECRK